MNVQTERRAPFTTRIAFDTMVEVGGALGPTFEAKALDVSLAGMRLRTAYLPEVGQPVSCRFELGATTIVCEGDVTWNREAAKGGEFGIAFTKLDEESGRALRAALEERLGAVPGERLRLHVEGLAQPLKARVSQARPRMITAKTDLAFLKLGNQCDVERVDEGCNAQARVGDVSVVIDPKSGIPQLIVSLRTAETPDPALAQEANLGDNQVTPNGSEEIHVAPQRSLEAASRATVREDLYASANTEEDQGDPTPMDAVSDEEAPRSAAPATFVSSREEGMKTDNYRDSDPALDEAAGPVAGSMDRAKAALAPIALSAKAKILLAWNKVQSMRSARSDEPLLEETNAPKRVTAKAPGGGLHTKGRKIVRGENSLQKDFLEEEPITVAPLTPAEKATQFAKNHKRKFAIGGAIGLAALLAGVAFSKPAPEAPLATVSPSAQVVVASAQAPTPMAPEAQTVAAAAATQGLPAPIPAAEPVLVDDGFDTASPAKKIGKVTPFAKGKVAHGKVLRLKMNAPIEKIQGARTPTGFTVALPGVKALEAAAPLAKSDKRLAGVHVANGGERSELTVDFKDGVPDYVVRAKGDTLEIVLAEPSEAEIASAAKPKAGSKLEKVSTKKTTHKKK